MNLKKLAREGVNLPWLRNPRTNRADPYLSLLVLFAVGIWFKMMLGSGTALVAGTLAGLNLNLSMGEAGFADVSALLLLIGGYLAKDSAKLNRAGVTPSPTEATP